MIFSPFKFDIFIAVNSTSFGWQIFKLSILPYIISLQVIKLMLTFMRG